MGTTVRSADSRSSFPPGIFLALVALTENDRVNERGRRFVSPALELQQSFARVVESWETADKASELSDISVCTSWGITGKELYLIDVFPAPGISGIEARCARAIRTVAPECRVDRGQGLGHPADPGADAGGPLRRHPVQAAIRLGHALSASPKRSGCCRICGARSPPWRRAMRRLGVTPRIGNCCSPACGWHRERAMISAYRPAVTQAACPAEPRASGGGAWSATEERDGVAGR